MNILEFPEEIIETIVSFLTYHEASEARAICKLFNKYCQMRLNKGFAKVDKLHAQIQKEVKNKLPRRESERRNHPLARHVDILSAVETRLSLLGMSYMKFIDTGLCCFIPGKKLYARTEKGRDPWLGQYSFRGLMIAIASGFIPLSPLSVVSTMIMWESSQWLGCCDITGRLLKTVLDELLCILRTLQSTDQPPRSHEFLQELRDISSMAMEHFDEKIAPGLKSKLPPVSLPYPFSESCPCPMDPNPGPSTLSLFTAGPSPIFSPTTTMRSPSIRSEVNTLGAQLRVQSATVRQIRKETTDSKVRFTHQRKKILQQEKKINQQGQVIQELEKKVNDLNQKFIDLSAELIKLKGSEEADGTKTIAAFHKHTEECKRGNNSNISDLLRNEERKESRNKAPKRKQGVTTSSYGKRSKR